MDKITGVLHYNPDTDRMGITVADLWEVTGLYCGDLLDIWINGEWILDRIELSNTWYLVNSNLKGSQLEGLEVRY